MSTLRVAALDLSLTATGLADSTGWCETIGAKDITTLPLGQRAAALAALKARILTALGTPDLALIEAPAYSRAGGGAHERAGLWWDLVRTLLGREVPVVEIFTQHLKLYACGRSGAGKGNALPKGAIIDAVARRWPAFATGGDDNMADAAVMVAMGCDHLGVPLGSVPKAHRAALERVAWPTLGQIAAIAQAVA